MGEPEGLLIEGARVAVAGARDLWWRVRPPGTAPDLALGQVRPRLELLLGALYGRRVPLLPADPEPAPTWLARLLGRAPRHLAPAGAPAATDGRHVWLPRVLDARDGQAAALDRYRLLAVEQAARIARGFARAHPHDASRTERDLYWVAAAAVVDRGLARELPGLAPGLRAARGAALVARPSLERLTEAERAVERMVRGVLAADPLSPAPAGVDTPDDARAWARTQALGLRTAGRYRGVAPVALWGEPRPPAPAPGSRAGDAPEPSPPRPGRTTVLRRRPRARPARDDEDDASPGMWMVRLDDPTESAEDPLGLQRPADHDDSADAGALGDALADLPEARIVRTPGSPPEVLQSDEAPLGRVAGDTSPRDGASGITYPEWDHRPAAYRFPGAIVRPRPAAEGGGEWADRVLERRATLVRQVRRRFDGLRPRRVRLGRQPDGADLDLAAYVTAFADRRAGQPGEDRLYTASRPARRDLAIAVLVDVSASTDAWVSGSLRIVDVEKEALVILLEALDVLGDRHAVLAFSGEGPRAVHILTVKGFDEASRTAARRRIAALEPDGYTRVGAAVRHASALLGRERARHRLLLLLSDGKPNDVDEYAGRYGIEDTRQAVAEAHLQGLVPFCLTVDREAPAYLPAIFGPRGFAVLPRPELLPTVLVEILRSLVTT
jgi:nitric oxide reductase NorD protein